MAKKMKVSEVFGIGVASGTPAYVDRGDLDLVFTRALAAKRHVSIHGGSKQGKTWLRERGLQARDSVVVQCTTTSSASTVLEEALAQLGVTVKLSQSGKNTVSGTISSSVEAEAGNTLFAKVKGMLSASSTLADERQTMEQFLGQSVANLQWVATAIRLSGKRLVVEDFHYLPEAQQEVFASWMKALGEYGVYVIIVGVWPRDHQMTYFNGDLDGRVDDIHLTWSDNDLRKVLSDGTTALKLDLSPSLVTALVEDSYGNVGLVQRLAERLCHAAKIDEQTDWVTLDIGPELAEARLAVANQMRGRFEKFASNFVRGMRRMPEGLVVYLHLLRAFTRADDQLLLAQGLDTRDLLSEFRDQNIRQSDLTQALDRVQALQAKIKVSPPVLAYETASRRVVLLDRAFLFFRRHGNPIWPWNESGYEITNDLADTEPINLFSDEMEVLTP